MFLLQTLPLIFLLAAALPGETVLAVQDTAIFQLLAEARSSARKGGYPEALEKLENALSLAQESNDPLTQAITLDNMAEIYRLQGNSREALDRYAQALKIYKDIGHSLGASATERKVDEMLGRAPSEKQEPQDAEPPPPVATLPSETREKLINNAIDRIRSRVKEQQGQEEPARPPQHMEPDNTATLPTAMPPEATSPPPISADPRQSEYTFYLETVKANIVRAWKYPQEASKEREEGKVDVEFTILKNGALQDVRILRSSGFSSLDREALRAVGAASPFAPIPAKLSLDQLSIRFTFNYTLAANQGSP
ncbi:MAG TPA: TonB family protein [Candidatus Binatia bacterium]